ncbi:MAG: flagellar biosynthetic protein FliR [Desulfobacteraceae bacterium]|nr:MAG: flagellar biosynthetic protein FliR [Desulfobacteraceae bacterium]
MLLLNLPADQFQLFLFVLVRVGAILFTIPFLDARNVPMIIKASLAMAVAVMIMPRLDVAAPNVLGNPFALILGLVSEAAVGWTISLSIQLLFAGVQLAGQLAGFQMGFAIANVVDPASSLQVPILSQFLNLLALMIFFSVNAHFYFIKALIDAFDLIPPMSARLDGRLVSLIMAMAAKSFVIAVKVSAPVMVALLLTHVALGLTARTVPQMHIFIVAMPLQILLGLIFLSLSLPFISSFLEIAFKELGHNVTLMIRLFQ